MDTRQARQAYHRAARAGELALPLVVDKSYVQKILDALRPTSKPVRCWWCSRPLVGPTCPTCDRDVDAWT